MLYLSFSCLPSLAQSQPTGPVETLPQVIPGEDSNQHKWELLGSISGLVVDQNGNLIPSARLTLTPEGNTGERDIVSGADGRFTFMGVAPGGFQLTITAEGFGAVTKSGILHSGEAYDMAGIALPVAATTTEVEVTIPKYELAEEQIKVEEKQHVLGFIPNFYVTYDRKPLSLSTKQKFELAWKTNVDPFTFLSSAAVAAGEQAANGLSGYGQGAQGYAKRFGAAYADGFIGNMIGNAILPSLLKQDPRYFYKGTGSTRSRILYALANAVVCKGDNGHWQPNYSGIGGSLAAGGISNLYYPASSRNGVALTFENAGAGIGFSGVANLFQEFLVRKLTPHAQAPSRTGP